MSDYLSEASLFRNQFLQTCMWTESRAFFGMEKRKWTDSSTNMLNMKMLKSHPSFHPVRSVWGPDCAIQSIRDLGVSIFAGWKIQHLSSVPTRPNFMRQAPGKESSWSWCKMRWSCPRPVLTVKKSISVCVAQQIYATNTSNLSEESLSFTPSPMTYPFLSQVDLFLAEFETWWMA